MIGSDLLRYKTGQRYLIYDTETEGLNLFASRPWQISYAICTAKEIESINVRYIRWPELRVSDEAARVTRFNMSQYLQVAEEPELVLQDFEHLLLDPQYLLVGQNILGFDIYITEIWRRLCGRKTDWSYLSRIIDTNCLSKAYKKGIIPSGDRLGFMYRMMSVRERGLKTSLGTMCREFGLPYDEHQAHDAGKDVEYTHALLKELLWKVEVR